MTEDPVTLEKAREVCTVVKVHAPTLTDNMSPDFRLINVSCPFEKDGHCGECPCFMGVDLSETEGAIFVSPTFDGFCAGGHTDE